METAVIQSSVWAQPWQRRRAPARLSWQPRAIQFVQPRQWATVMAFIRCNYHVTLTVQWLLFFPLSSSVGCCFLSFRFVPSVLIYDTHIPLMIEIQFNSSRIPFLLKHFERSNHIGDSRRFAPFIDVHHQQTRTQQQIDCNSMQQLDLIQSNSPTPYTTPQ